MKKHRILAITLARGGSKSIRKKNIYKINKKPLLYYTIKEAKKSKLITRYLVSTDDKEIADLLQIDLEASTFENGNWKSNKNSNSEPGSNYGHKMKWYTFLNLKESILEDLEKIKNHPLIPKNINIHGFIYDVKTGKLESIESSK